MGLRKLWAEGAVFADAGEDQVVASGPCGLLPVLKVLSCLLLQQVAFCCGGKELCENVVPVGALDSVVEVRELWALRSGLRRGGQSVGGGVLRGGLSWCCIWRGWVGRGYCLGRVVC